MDIRFCIVDIYGAKFYKRLDKEDIDFGEVVSGGSPLAFYIMVGQYVITKKYYVKDPKNNYFEMSINKNDLFVFFQDFYLANHRFKKTVGQLKDLITGRAYASFIPKGNTKRIDEVAESILK